MKLLRPHADAEDIEPVPDRLLSLSLGGEGYADGTSVLLLPSVGLGQPIRVANDLEALVEGLDLFLDDR